MSNVITDQPLKSSTSAIDTQECNLLCKNLLLTQTTFKDSLLSDKKKKCTRQEGITPKAGGKRRQAGLAQFSSVQYATVCLLLSVLQTSKSAMNRFLHVFYSLDLCGKVFF